MEVSLAEFDLSALHDLKPGDVIEVPGLFPGLDPDEAVVGMVRVCNAETITLRFTFHGVWIGTYQLKFSEGKWNRVLAESRT